MGFKRVRVEGFRFLGLDNKMGNRWQAEAE